MGPPLPISMQPQSPLNRHLLAVLSALEDAAVLSQAELVERTGLSRGTVAKAAVELDGRELVEERPPDPGSLRRTPTRYRLRPTAALALCIDIGKRHVVAAVGGPAGTIGRDHPRELDPGTPASDALDIAADLAKSALNEYDPTLDPRELAGVCIGLPAPVDLQRGQVASALDLSTWIGLDPPEELRRRLGEEWADLCFVLDNDTNLTALGEHRRGAARASHVTHQDTVIVVKWSDGIGGAVLIDGKLLTGSRGIAMELGHTPVFRENHECFVSEPEHACKRCGHFCLESHAGATVLLREARRRLGEAAPESFGALVSAANSRPGHERELLRKAARYLGEVLGVYVSLFNARLVVLCSRSFGAPPSNQKAYSLIANDIRAGMLSTAFPTAMQDVRVVLGERYNATVEGGIVAALRAGAPSFFARKLATTPR